VIAYFDTSALIPLLVDDPGSDGAGYFWDQALRVVSVRLARVETRAGLAQAARTQRISRAQLRAFVRELDELLDQLDFVDVDEELVRIAADLAESYSLRAYDAVHLAAALTVASDELVVVAGDRALLSAATTAGLATGALR
jgi:predicted nucleic acid-binding protein